MCTRVSSSIKLTDKIQSLGRPTDETKKNIHTQTEEFRAEATTPLQYKTEEERPKVTRKPILIYPVTIQE